MTTTIKPLNPPRLKNKGATNVTKVSSLTAVGPKDPLAQSFFTYGIQGGCFVTKLDLYFQAKDNSAPVMIEIREMINGFPSNELRNKYARVSIPASSVLVSQNASLKTTFTFDRPIYLREDSDYCFVVMSNSKNYFVWTSKLSEKSNETGQIVTEQPYTGSLFKSENNITWNAEQYEDIKFTLYKAAFDTSSNASLDLFGLVPLVRAFGENVYTLKDSNKVVFYITTPHGLDVGSLVALTSPSGGVLNGITEANMNGIFEVVDVIDEYTFSVKVSGIATSSGPIFSSGNIQNITVLNGGSGYNTVPTISFTGGGGTGATATATIDTSGKVNSITITNRGTGYTSVPEVIISGGGGVGAGAKASVQAVFSLYTNKVANTIFPLFTVVSPGNTRTQMQIQTTSGNYIGGNDIPYDVNPQKNFTSLGTVEDNNVWIASPYNEGKYLNSNKSLGISLDFYSDNPNVSPLIDLNDNPKILIKNNRINSQEGELILDSVTNTTASIDSLSLTSPGSGYMSVPTVFIEPPFYSFGVQATATATILAGEVTGITLTNPGSGYISIPTVLIAPPATGTQATAQAFITNFNTELLPSEGRAYSKYITKAVTLATPSTGIRVFCTAFSTSETSFEFYARTSLSTNPTPHNENGYTLMSCDVSRDKSVRRGQYLEYEFYLDNLTPFDVINIKIVLRSLNPAKMPYISDYRAIVLA